MQALTRKFWELLSDTMFEQSLFANPDLFDTPSRQVEWQTHLLKATQFPIITTRPGKHHYQSDISRSKLMSKLFFGIA